MPRYEIVAHVAVELDETAPEAAAAAFKRDLLARAGNPIALHGLAVWRPSAGSEVGPIPPSARRQLDGFFAGVARCAATEEEAFRVRVEEILATAPREAVAEVIARRLAPVVVEGPAVDDGGAAGWESEGGAIARELRETRER